MVLRFLYKTTYQLKVMARQHGIVNFTGPLGGISFYYTQTDGYLARTSAAHSRERIMHDKRFARVKENSAEFGVASHAGKILRQAIRHLTAGVADKRMYTRMTGTLVHVLRGDAVHKRGKRTVADGDLAQLKGFEFNRHRAFTDLFRGHGHVLFDEQAGTATFRTNAEAPAHAFAAPEGATHAQFVVAFAAVDFNAKAFKVQEACSAYIDLRNAAPHSVDLVQQMPARNAPIIMLIGVRFFQKVNAQMYAMAEGNAMQIAELLTATTQPPTTAGKHQSNRPVIFTSPNITIRKVTHNEAPLQPDKPG
jgi:hypothetical protein